MNIILGIFIGFVAGLFFSRGRADPVRDAGEHAVRFLQRAFDWIAGVFKGDSSSRKNGNNEPENR